jgi:oxygen-independent coproporphyrinogen-3 oxidase
VQYEISNWAQPGFECAHNLQYWQNEAYLGVGAGASGYAAQIRYEIVKQIRRYVELASVQREVRQFPLTDSVAYSESIDHPTAMAEHMLTGLRLVQQGVNVEGFRQRFGVSLDEVYGRAIERLTRDGLLRREAGHVRLTPAARLISNRVFVQFI